MFYKCLYFVFTVCLNKFNVKTTIIYLFSINETFLCLYTSKTFSKCSEDAILIIWENLIDTKGSGGIDYLYLIY